MCRAAGRPPEGRRSALLRAVRVALQHRWAAKKATSSMSSTASLMAPVTASVSRTQAVESRQRNPGVEEDEPLSTLMRPWGHSRTIPDLGDGLTAHRVDEGGLAHVRDPENHRQDGPAPRRRSGSISRARLTSPLTSLILSFWTDTARTPGSFSRCLSQASWPRGPPIGLVQDLEEGGLPGALAPTGSRNFPVCGRRGPP